MSANGFTGFTPDAFVFLLELRFNNNREFFEANRARYEGTVKRPMQALAAALLPAALRIDGEFDRRMGCILSRIRRDTRFSKDKSPYRNHAWLAFRRPGRRISEGMTLYFEISPEEYGYGMGMYAPDTALMKGYRERILARPARFLELHAALEEAGMALVGESYRRERFPDAPEAIRPTLNRRNLSWSFTCPDLRPTMSPALTEELIHAMERMGPMYRFLHGENEG